jgi:hypothetical protein
MKSSPSHLAALLLVVLFTPSTVHAQGGLARKAVTELVEFFAETGAKKSAKELIEIGGEKTVREVIEKAAAEGGDDLVRQVVALSKSSGPRALKALESDPALMAKALKGIPEGKVTDAVIEAARNPSLMVKLVRAHGDEVLTASARHPGIGTQVIEEFGGAGLRATKELGTDEVLVLARTKGFRELPEAAQCKFVTLLDRKPREVANFLMLAAGGTGIILTADVVKKIEDDVFGKDGKGGRLTKTMVFYVWLAGGIFSAFFIGYAGIKLWGVWHKTNRSATR